MAGRYTEVEEIGRGAYGKVYKAIDESTGKLVALKEIPPELGQSGISPTAIREIGILKLLSGSLYIVHLYTVGHQRDEQRRATVFLVLEYLDTDLKNFIDSRPLGPNHVRRFLFQLLKGVAHCHGHGVLHRDLKPRNLLIQRQNEILKIADFGLARSSTVPNESYSPELVTLHYRAPEILLGSKEYFTGVDMWSVACIFAEMSTGKVLFEGRSVAGQLTCIFRLLGTPTEEVWPGVTSLANWRRFHNWPQPQSLEHLAPLLGPDGMDLLSKMLIYNPSKRITATCAMEHPYFASLDQSRF